MDSISTSLAVTVKNFAYARGYRIDGASYTRVNDLIGMALREAEIARSPTAPQPEDAELQRGMVEFAEATMAAAKSDETNMVGVAHVESGFAVVRRRGIFPFSAILRR